MHRSCVLAGRRPRVAKTRGRGQRVVVDQDMRDVVGIVHERDGQAVEVRIILRGNDIGHDGGDISNTTHPG